ncbi:MAG: hypothetical protein ABFS86_20700 [Planctomycetota bacterium]
MGDIRVFRNAAQLAALPADTTAVKGDDVVDRDLEDIHDLDSLSVVYLDGCSNLTDAALVHVARIRKLEELYVTGDGITDDGLATLSGCRDLVEFGLDAPISGEGFRHLEGLPSLAELHLPMCPKLDPANLPILAMLPVLTKLGFYSCRRMTDGWLDRIAGITGLRALELRNCPEVSRERIQRLSGEIPGLVVDRT